MGNTISSSAGPIPPISGASTIIGFLSFLFTLATALRVFWSNISTLASANRDVRDVLPSLKQALYEERAHLRAIRKRCRSQYEEGGFRVLSESLRHLMEDFRGVEEYFIEFDDRSGARGYKKGGAGGAGREVRESMRGHYGENHNGTYSRSAGAGAGAGAGGEKRGRDGYRNGDKSARDSPLEDRMTPEWDDDYYHVSYRAVTLSEKFSWLKMKGQVNVLGERLSRVQTRRIARQTADLSIDTKYVARTMSELQDRIDDLEQRLNQNNHPRRDG